MAISTNGTVIARLAGGLYNTVMSNATYLEVASQDPSTLANTLYARDFAKSTDLAVATTLLANLGLASQAGLDAWVAAQLTAAGAANKGAKIVSLLNDFAGLASDATWGTYATSFNTKVDAALAASQMTGSVEAKFEAAGTVASTAATFTLTTGVDTGTAFTGGAGNDTFTANNAALGALDSIDGGAGANTLNITDTVSIPSLAITAANIQNLNVTSSAGSIGTVAATLALAARQEVTYNFAATGISLGLTGQSGGAGGTKIVDVTVGGVKKTVGSAAVDATVALITAAIEDILDAGYGTDQDFDGSGSVDIDTQVWASYSSNVMTVKAVNPGTALPTITIAAGTGGDGTFTATSPAVFKTTVMANSAAVAAASASTFAAPTGVTAVVYDAATDAMVSSKTTADTTVDAGGVVKLATAKTATVSAGDSVQVSGVSGAVSITTAVPATDLAAVTATGWTAAPGVFVRNGTTVSVTETAGTSTAGAAATGNATKIQIGSTPTSSTLTAGTASGAKLNSTASQYPEVVGNLSSAPTGDVTISVKTPYTDTKGYKNVTYGTGTVDIYMNGGTTASVTGAAGVTVTDLQTIKLLPSASGTAAPGTSTLTTVNLTGVSSSVGIHSDAISNLSILDTAGQTVTINSNTGKNNVALNVSVGNSTPTISASQASSVAFTGITAPYEKIGDNLVTANSGSTVVLQAAKATALSFAGSSDITLGTTSTAAAVTSITSTSGKKVTLGDVATSGYLTKLSSIDASGASGALSVTIGAPGAAGGVGYGMNVKGGSGNDTVTLKAGTSSASVVNVDGATVATSVSLGAGNDKLLNGGVVGGSSTTATATLSNTSTIDGGEGSDTISVSLLNSGNAATAKNFEILDVKGSTSGTTSFDASLLTNSTITGVAVSGDIGGTTTISNIAGTALTVSISDTGTSAAGSLTATLATSTGTADTAAITYAAVSSTTATVTAQTSRVETFKTSGIESVTIASGATLTNVGDTMSNILDTFQDTSNKTATITITGANKFTLGGYVSATSYTDGVEQYTTAPTTAITDVTTASALKTIDASAATGAVTIVAGATQVDIHGDTDSSTDSASITNLIFTGLTITGGSGADKLVNLAAAGIVNGGDGADAITVTGSAAVVDGGAGADTITVNASVSTTLTGGASANTYVLTAATAGDLFASAPKMTTITDYKTSDTLSIGDALPWAKADVSSAGSLQDALGLAAADGAAGDASWFTWGNFTYIVKDAGSGSAADALSTEDIIVKLTGIFDLSVLAGDATTGLIGLA